MIGGGVFSQPKPPVPMPAIELDSLNIEAGDEEPQLKTDSLLKKGVVTDEQKYPKKFQDNFQKTYQTEDFDYSGSKPKTSFWDRLIKIKDKIVDYLFGDIDGFKVNEIGDKIITFICVLSIGVLAYFVIRYLMSKDGNWFFTKRNQKINVPNSDIIENIHEINFPQIIAKYEQEKDYRSAIRYQFLYMLKKLTDKKLIDWNPEKTNKEYLMEIKKSDLQKQFKDAAFIFDYVWYGEFSVDQNAYEIYKKENFNF